MYGDTNEEIVNAVLKELGIDADRWSYEYRNAMSAVDKIVQRELDRVYDLGFDEGEEEASYSIRDDAYNEGIEVGKDQATFDDALRNYLTEQTDHDVLYIDEVLDEDEVVVRYTYQNYNPWVSREATYTFDDYYEIVDRLRR